MPRTPKDALLKVRLTAGEKEGLQRRAEDAGLKLSAYVRSVLLPPDDPELVKRAEARARLAGEPADRLEERVKRLERTMPKSVARRLAAREALEELRGS